VPMHAIDGQGDLKGCHRQPDKRSRLEFGSDAHGATVAQGSGLQAQF
jgi:hypothetical protein